MRVISADRGMTVSNIELRMENRTVRAEIDGKEVGHITVPDIPFCQCGVSIPLAGIQAVRTDENYRRQGIGSRMMARANEFAVDEGYTCSAVSTGRSNIARRLYARAGNVHLFTQARWQAPVDDITLPATSGPPVREYTRDDEIAVLELIRTVQRPYFGTREKSAERFRKLREGWKDDSPEPVAFVAEDGDQIIGFAHRLHYWSGLESEIFAPGDDMAVMKALAARLVERLQDTQDDCFQVSASDCQQALSHLLYEMGLRETKEHVFMFNILDLQGYLDATLNLYTDRAASMDVSALPARVKIHSGDQAGVLVLDGPAPAISLRASRRTMSRILCGRTSAWDAYLTNTASIKPQATVQTAAALQTLFPQTPYQHPALDRW